MGAAEDLNIAGKDWLTEQEAAHYCGVSLPHFRNGYHQLGISPVRFLGKKLYSKAELYQVIANSDPWQQSPSNGGKASHTYPTKSVESVVASLLDESRGSVQKPSGRRPRRS